MKSEKQKVFFPNLDGLRFFSFLAVFLLHVLVTDSRLIHESSWFKQAKFLAHADLGVSFFFVLSGFLISYLLLMENQSRGKIDVGAFYIRRILRIWPLYFFCVIYGFIITPYLRTWMGQSPVENANPVLCSTFLNNFDRIWNGPPQSAVLGVLWSIAVEEQFYLLWPLLLLLTPRKYYPAIFFSVITASIIYRSFVKTGVAEYHTLGVISDMAIGGLAAFLALRNQFFEKLFLKIPKPWTLAFYIVTALLILFWYQVFTWPILIVLRRVIMASCFVWIILEQNYNANSLFKISNFKIISRLGKYTYALYCLHPIGISVTVVALRHFGMNQYAWQIIFVQIPVSLLASILLSYVSYHAFEKHFLKLKERFAYITKGAAS
ncbi:MAG: acyltransferase [Bacteroidota bacterium]